MRSAAAFIAVVVVGAVALAAFYVGGGGSRVQNLGVSVTKAVAILAPDGRQVCERPISLGDRVDAVEFNPGTPPPTPALRVQIRDAASGRLLASGQLPGRFDPAVPQTVGVSPPVTSRRDIALCIEDLGPGGVGIFGSDIRYVPCSIARNAPTCAFGRAQVTSSVTEAYVGSRPTGGAIEAVFLRAHPRGLFNRVSDTIRHASAFRPGFVGTGFWWGLLVLLVLAAPACLVWCLRSSEEAQQRGTVARAGERPPPRDLL